MQKYQSGTISVEQAAQAITRPISTTSIPSVGGESDDIIAVCQLWDLLMDALVEWPNHSVPSIVALLVAISKVPDYIHRGETLDNGKPLTWHSLPLMYMCWYDKHWMSPGRIVKEATDVPQRERLCAIYVKIKDAESQIIAAGFFRWSTAISYIISVLEKEPSTQDQDPRSVSTRMYPDFQLPAIHSWIKHNGPNLFQCINNDNLEDLHVRDNSHSSQPFKNSKDRWVFWKERLLEIGTETSDKAVLEQAQETIKLMEYIESDPKIRA